MRYHLTKKSSNTKTGKIAVTTTSADSCPPACPFRHNGCYADGGPLKIHWDRISRSERGTDLAGLCSALESLPAGTMVRHNQAGDLPGRGNHISSTALKRLTQALKRFISWTYTHKPLTEKTVSLLRQAIAEGFVINISANGLEHVDAVSETGLPVTTVLPADHTAKVTRTPQGRRVVTCPAVSGGATCETCGNGLPLCARANRDYVIGFPAHGASKRRASAVANG